jgi:hypothetical protein
MLLFDPTPLQSLFHGDKNLIRLDIQSDSIGPLLAFVVIDAMFIRVSLEMHRYPALCVTGLDFDIDVPKIVDTRDCCSQVLHPAEIEVRRGLCGLQLEARAAQRRAEERRNVDE